MADVKLSKLVKKRLPSATSLGAFAATTNAPANVAPDAGGALTAGVWKEVLNISTPGVLLGAVVITGGATSKTVGIRVTIDGTTVVTAEHSAAMTNTSAFAAIGMLIPSNTSACFGWAPFQTLKVEIRSNISTSEPKYGVHYTGLES